MAAPALAAIALLAASPDGGSLARGGEAVALLVSQVATPRELLALAVTAPATEPLAGALETAAAEALARRGFAVVPLRGAQLAADEASASALGADRLVRLRAGVAPARRDVTLVVEIVPTRANFFLQRAPGVRPAPSRLLTVAVPADAWVLALARPAEPRAVSLDLAVRPLARLPERVIALAAGDPGSGRTALAAATPDALLLLGPDGAAMARHPLPPSALAPVRRPAAGVAVGDFGGGRIAWRLAGAPAGEVLALSGGSLRPVASLEAVPLWAGDGGRVFGAFVPGKAVLADLVVTAVDPWAKPRSPREWVAFAGAPRPGRVAFAAVSGEGTASLLGRDLSPGGTVEGVGAGLALADLDGDGEPELVASDAQAGPGDRIRVLRLPAGALLHEPVEVAGTVLAGAAADLTGDGLDDAVLAAALPGGGTELWLVTADGRARERR